MSNIHSEDSEDNILNLSENKSCFIPQFHLKSSLLQTQTPKLPLVAFDKSIKPRRRLQTFDKFKVLFPRSKLYSKEIVELT